jgi:pimeloyl-ACP methyl ester carboxylesterase
VGIAGFEVIVPDLRGFGDSDLSTTDTYDIVRYGLDLLPPLLLAG